MIEAKDYAFDLDKMMDFVFGDDSKNSESEITEVYALDEDTSELVLVNKQLHEIKSNEDSAKSSLRYDLLKMMFTHLVTYDVEESLVSNVIKNTMIDKGFLKKIEE